MVDVIPPTQRQREDMLCYMLKDLPLSSLSSSEKKEGTQELEQRIKRWSSLLAMRTAGCVASDLKRLCVDAFTKAYARSHGYREGTSSHYLYGKKEQEKELIVTWEDLKLAALSCIPSQLADLDVSTVQHLYQDDDGDEDIDKNLSGDDIDKDNSAQKKRKEKNKNRYDK
eukprot:8016768-Ditylum_brightwellii.AAC.1